jgi:hypothetical protein
MTGPSLDFDPDRDLPRPVQMSFTTDTEVESAVEAIEAQQPNVSRSTILHRIVRRALLAAPASR